MADSLDYGLLSPRVTLNELLEKEAESLTPAARYERSTSWTRKFFRPALIISRDAHEIAKVLPSPSGKTKTADNGMVRKRTDGRW